MRVEIDEILEVWKKLSELISKYPPKYPEVKNYKPFDIQFLNGKYIMVVDLDVFN